MPRTKVQRGNEGNKRWQCEKCGEWHNVMWAARHQASQKCKQKEIIRRSVAHLPGYGGSTAMVVANDDTSSHEGEGEFHDLPPLDVHFESDDDGDDDEGEETFTNMKLAVAMDGLTKDAVDRILKVVRNPRFDASKLTYGSASSYRRYMDELTASTLGNGFKVVELSLHDNETFAIYTEVDFKMTFMARDPVSVLQELVQRKSKSLLFERRSMAGEFVEVVDGSWYEEICEGKTYPVLALQVAQDKTHLNAKGSRTAMPVMLTLGNIPVAHRQKRDAWDLVAYAPEAEEMLCRIHEKYKVDKAEEANIRCAFQQEWMKALWEPLRRKADEFVVGDSVYHVRLACMCVDMLEAWNIACTKHHRCVLCTTPKAHYATSLDMDTAGAKKRRRGVNSEGNRGIQPYFAKWPQCDIYECVGSPDDLHNERIGEMEHLMKIIFGNSKGAKGAFSTCGASTCLSVRNIACLIMGVRSMKRPDKWQDQLRGTRVPVKGLNQDKITGEERLSIMLRLPVVFKALEIMESVPWKEKRKKEKVREVAQVSFDVVVKYLEMYKSRRATKFSESDLEDLKKKTKSYMTASKQLACFNKNQMKYPKHHLQLHYPECIKRWGIELNWSTQTTEGALKDVAKAPGGRLRNAGDRLQELLPQTFMRSEAARQLKRDRNELVEVENTRRTKPFRGGNELFGMERTRTKLKDARDQKFAEYVEHHMRNGYKGNMNLKESIRFEPCSGVTVTLRYDGDVVTTVPLKVGNVATVRAERKGGALTVWYARVRALAKVEYTGAVLGCKRKDDVAFVQYLDKVSVDGKKDKNPEFKKSKLAALRWFKGVYEEVEVWGVIPIVCITNLARMELVSRENGWWVQNPFSTNV